MREQAAYWETEAHGGMLQPGHRRRPLPPADRLPLLPRAAKPAPPPPPPPPAPLRRRALPPPPDVGRRPGVLLRDVRSSRLRVRLSSPSSSSLHSSLSARVQEVLGARMSAVCQPPEEDELQAHTPPTTYASGPPAHQRRHSRPLFWEHTQPKPVPQAAAGQTFERTRLVVPLLRPRRRIVRTEACWQLRVAAAAAARPAACRNGAHNLLQRVELVQHCLRLERHLMLHVVPADSQEAQSRVGACCWLGCVASRRAATCWVPSAGSVSTHPCSSLPSGRKWAVQHPCWPSP